MWLLKKEEKKLALSFNFTFHSIHDVLSQNNSAFGDYVDRIYPTKFEIKKTPDAFRTASFLDIHPEIDSEGRLRTKSNDERDDFNVTIVNLSCIYSNATPGYRTHISQFIRYCRACISYQDFDKELLL